MRRFEKISESQFIEDIIKLISYSDDEFYGLYDSIKLPERSTSKSAGYDIRAVGDWTIAPGHSMKIPTGLKVSMEPNEVLLIFIRSSLGTKYNLSLSNGTGVIDSDYYNNKDNEGHFWITLKNNGESAYDVKNGDRLCQGIFVEYKVTDDDNATAVREGGFGSTGSN